jgi:aspartate/tyrosine/aromatic aminotransferase
MTALDFGQNVYQESLKLQEEGRDANQIAKILSERDPAGHNYGIGIVLDGQGQPMASSSLLLEYAAAELGFSQKGTYMNSGKVMEELKTAVLAWQRIPEQYWGQFKLALPSDAGTGAVKTGVEIGLMLNPQLNTLGIEELGWPAYKAIARVARINCEEYADDIISGANTLPIYQAGPMNTTGLVRDKAVIEARAKSAADTNTFVILDRAYPGFEFARQLAAQSYDDVMRMSYELQVQPFIDQGVPFCAAIGPTKAFVTFALRPCGLLLIFNPDSAREKEMTNMLNTTIRARGSAFEHPITRAFAKAMVQDLARFEAEHQVALERLAQAEATWRKLVQGTPIEYLYAENYAGLFRNPKARDGAAVHIYNEHIYPVFAQQRCRQNVTGIPDDEALAQKHVSVFAEQCF